MGGTATFDLKEVYARESQLEALLITGGDVRLAHGEVVHLGKGVRENWTPAQVGIVQGIIEGLWSRYQSGPAPTLRVSTKASRKAGYHPGKHEIRMPASQWAWNTLLFILHELAHALDNNPDEEWKGQKHVHGSSWTVWYIDLITDVYGEEARILAFDVLWGRDH
jgi:hypothetical protein